MSLLPVGTAAWPSSPSGALHTGGACVAGASLGTSSRSPAKPRHRPSISHVIPLRLVQTLNLHHWNCNVFGVCRKMTTINYVRNLGGGGVVAACGLRGLALQSLRPLHTSGAWPLWCRPWASQGPRVLRFLADLLRVVTNVVNRRCFSSGFLIRCYKCRQSDGFFAENCGFWVRIDDVCNSRPRKGLQIAPV